MQQEVTIIFKKQSSESMSNHSLTKKGIYPVLIFLCLKLLFLTVFFYVQSMRMMLLIRSILIQIYLHNFAYNIHIITLTITALQ